MTYHLAGDSTVAPMTPGEEPMSGWGHALNAVVDAPVRNLAHELDAPLIDLTVFTTWLYEDLGDAGSAALLSHYAPGETAAWPDGLVDDTHFRFEGARRIAAFVARSLRAIEGRDGDQPARGSVFTA